MTVDELLERLQKVRRISQDQFLACCPAHDDVTPSLAVRDASGHVLMHCFGGCSIEEICKSLGITLSDLMPQEKSPYHHSKMPWSARTVLEAIAFQATIVAIAASDMANGKKLSLAEKDQLFNSSGAINNAIEYCTR